MTTTTAETSYAPASAIDRRNLAAALTAMLKTAGFTGKPCRDTSGEWVFERVLTDDGSLVLQVWTGAVGHAIDALECRKAGADAIRACAVYRKAGERDRGVVSDTRVNRTGTIEGITARTLDRMREVWRNAKGVQRCGKCGAPMFKARSGSMCCAALCWKPAADRAMEVARTSPSYGVPRECQDCSGHCARVGGRFTCPDDLAARDFERRSYGDRD